MGRAPLALFVLALFLAPLSGASHAASERRLVSYDGALPRVAGVEILRNFAFARVALVEGAPDAIDALRLAGAHVYADEALTLEMDRVRAEDDAEPTPTEAASWPTGAGVTVALVDSGVDASHPGFAGRMAAAVRIDRSGAISPGGTDDDGHGTHVAGIVAGDGARSQNGRLRGLAPQAKLVSVDISDSFTTTSAVRAFEWVHDHRGEHGIRVVSSSWGREKADAHYDPDDPVIRASDALAADGLVVVFSAGNRGHDGSATLTTEATNPNVLTVGAVSPSGHVEPYSSRGPARDTSGATLDWVKPDLVAPGTGVYSARTTTHLPAGGSDEERYYTIMNGTSMAAPQVAAAAALVLQARPSLSPVEVMQVLQDSARDVGAPGPDAETGFGMLDVRAALAAARSLDDASRTVTVESRIPIHAEARVAGAQGIVVLDGAAPHVPPTDSITLPVALPPSTASVDLWLNWSGPGGFAATLEGDGGASWSFDADAPGALHLAHVAAREGSYRVVARPSGVQPDTTLALDGSALVRASRVVDAPAELHSRHLGAAASHPGFVVPEPLAEQALDLVSAKPVMVIGALLVLSISGAVVSVGRPSSRRRG